MRKVMFFCALACVMSACTLVMPEHSEPSFTYPAYDVELCAEIKSKNFSQDQISAADALARFVDYAVAYNSTPETVAKVMYIATNYNVTEEMVLYGLDNFIKTLNKSQNTKVKKTYSADKFVAFMEWHSAIMQQTDAEMLTERIMAQTKMSVADYPEWHRFVLTPWQPLMDAHKDKLPDRETILHNATISWCLNIK